MLLEMVQTPVATGGRGDSFRVNGYHRQTSQAGVSTAPSSNRVNYNGTQAKLEHLLQENQEITSLYNIGIRAASLSLTEVLHILYQECQRLIDTTNFAIALYDQENDQLDYVLVFSQGQQIKPCSVKLVKSGLAEQVLAHQTPLLIPSLKAAEHRLTAIDPTTETQTAYSWLGAPIPHPHSQANKAQGVIIMWRAEPHAFSQHDLWLLTAIAAQAALPLANVQLFQANQRQALELAMLKDIAQALVSTLQFDEVLNRLMEQIESIFKVEAGALLLTDPATGELVFQVACGQAAHTRSVQPFRLHGPEDLANRIAQTGQPVLLTRVESPQCPPLKLAAHLQLKLRNFLGIPLILYEQVIGVLLVLNKTEGTFTQHDLALLNALAPYVALAIHNARLYEGILAERDRMVALEEQVRKEIARDLHDGPTQLVSAMVMRAEFSLKALRHDPTQVAAELTDIYTIGQRTVHQMRTVLMALRPLELEQHGQGLTSALRVFLERRQQEVPQTHLTLEVQPSRADGLITRQEIKVENALFSIVQETINNALKHAGANSIRVQLTETATELCLLIEDDGKGFQVAEVMRNYAQRGSLGMLNIQERTELIGGQLTLNSTPGQGTRVVVCVPKTKEDRLKKRGTTGALTLPPRFQEPDELIQDD